MGGEDAGAEVAAENIPLLSEVSNQSAGDEGANTHIIRTGTVWTAVAHIITAVIGSGVLSLAWSMAQLGWIIGPIAMLFFAAVTVLQSSLLCDCYRTPDPEHGHVRNRSYMEAVNLYLGEKKLWICGIFQQVGLYGTGIAYTITVGTSLRAILKSDCYHKEGHEALCSYDVSMLIGLFGGVQIVLSQLPDFNNMEWLSIVSAIMSFCYSIIGFALGLVKVIENGVIKGGIGGVPTRSMIDKVWRISQGLGNIAFAYPYGILLLEIQDTLRSPPAENKTMKEASSISIGITTIFYLCCGCFGYAAFGNQTPGNLLTGFGFYEPYWLVDFANACIVLHLVGGYQVYCQPVFAFVDRWFVDEFPNSRFINNYYIINLPALPAYRTNLLRLCFRTLYVLSTTGIAMSFPYFNQILGLLGAFGFWPLSIYFPVEMYLVQKDIGAWTRKWVVLRGFSYVCLLISIFALVGSIQGLLTEKFN